MTTFAGNARPPAAEDIRPAPVFYLGTHQPHWLWRATFPMFVSHRQLARRRTLHHATCRWALDSGGFTELSLHGRWLTSPQDYVAAVTSVPRLKFRA